VFGEQTLALVKDSDNRKLQSAKGTTSLTLYVIPTNRVNTGNFGAYEDKVCWASCVHKKSNQGTCYVTAHSTLMVAKAFWSRYEANTHEQEFLNVTASYHVRATAHGDIGMLNAEGKLKVLELLLNSTHHVAYTAAWRSPEMQTFRRYVMASVSTTTDAADARAAGWHTYRVHSTDAPRAKGEVQCLVKGTGHASEQGRGCFSGCKTPCNGSRDIVSPNPERIQAIYTLWDASQTAH